VRSDHDPVQVQRVAFVVPADKITFETSFPLGLFTVTVEFVIVEPLIVVGAEKVIFGGKITVLEELFQAVSYTVTIIV
jgi:hypothetical protein